MRFIDVQDSNQGHGRKVALIALNVNELSLLQGMARQVERVLPKDGPTKRLRMVAHQMGNEMAGAIVQLEKSGDTKSKEIYPFDSKSII